jgi:hypothetical protein
LSKAISAKIQKRSAAPIPRSASCGNEHVSNPEFDPSFGSFHFPPSDMTVTSQDSITATSFGEAGHTKVQHSTPGAAQQIHRLDAMMFPSDDPLAYPNQPRADFGVHGSGLHHGDPGDVLHHDPTSYFVPQLYDGIEGQLLGPLPPYLMQPHGGPGINFPAQMYSDPVLPPQQMHSSQIRPHALGLQSEQELRQHMRDYDNILANTSWQGMFPQHGMD